MKELITRHYFISCNFHEIRNLDQKFENWIAESLRHVLLKNCNIHLSGECVDAHIENRVSLCAYARCFSFCFAFSFLWWWWEREVFGFLKQLPLNVKYNGSSGNRSQNLGYYLQVYLVIIAVQTHALFMALCILNYLLLRGSKGK